MSLGVGLDKRIKFLALPNDGLLQILQMSNCRPGGSPMAMVDVVDEQSGADEIRKGLLETIFLQTMTTAFQF